MAGGKETPRQKMIGMMYLVLTAMLALQVSSSLLQKFQLLNNSLEFSANTANKSNQKTIESIKAQVEKAGNRAEDLNVVKQADEVRKSTSALIAEIDGLKQQIIDQAGGGLDENGSGSVKNPSEEDKVAAIMIGAGNNGKAYALKDKLNGYSEQMGKYAGGAKFNKLGLDAAEDMMTSKDPDQKTKNFAELNFAQTPVPAALAVLSQKQSDIRRIEAETLDYLASKVGAKDIKFDKILAMISAESKVVVAGTKFKGEMFIAASSSSLVPRMSLNGSSLPVRDGKGQIEFTAQGGGFDKQGLARRVLTGSISFSTPSGRDTTVRLEQEYFVAKPSYEIESATSPPLYLGCANKLSIVSPQLGALWNPNFTADGGEVINSGGRGKITVIPSSRTVTINVFNQGNKLGDNLFRVNKVPKPSLEVLAGGQIVDERRGMPASQVRSISIRVIPDESFKNYSPDDANYRVAEATIRLARGNRPVGSPITISNGSGSVASLAQQAQPGDRYVIEIGAVQRRNFKGDISDAGVGNPIKIITLY